MLFLRKYLTWQILLLGLALSVLYGDVEAKKGKRKIKRKQPDDPFLPAMIVFNLDNTLWPFAMEIMQPPLNTTSVKHQIKDRVGRLFNMFPEVPDILEDLDSHWYKLGGLSDNSDIRRIEAVTDLFDVDQYFNAFESKPGNKTEQMQRLSERAKVPLENILYYDTNRIDLDDMKEMNVTTVLLDPDGGLTYAHLEQGFKVFRETKTNATGSTTA
ncbi:magnesium-dependent phosphatase 1-like [Homalodisca vitripennis]|uniref:Magnesium-dependent phosphatase-1 n=1 Tax=Homalodisca liturata TaxID=320908 RepID=A0A1B6JZ38_9HEMI|nr:magnesium-dependent phosphatase 1-like [Homalodisca vitripennis]